MLKRIFSVLFTVIAVFIGAILFMDEDFEDYENDYDSAELIGESGDPDQTWAIYWYLCGSDLESEVGFASDDMEEMMAVDLPENVKVVVQTGGAWQWMNDYVDSDCIQRYVYDEYGLELVDEQPSANMGDPSTLADFLYFAENNFPADRTAVIFWDHGGGTVAGAAFDEIYDYDSLTLDEFYDAFHSVYDTSGSEPPVDIIGFDTCLMGSIDTAYAFSDIGHYLVASEELEPGGGWMYTDFLQALADDPGMDGARLGQIICDTYMNDCGWFSEDEATMSVVDLTKTDRLFEAYDAMGAEAMTYALHDPSFFSYFGREAESSENYGGNTRDEGYANMVDLGHLAENCEDLLPETAGAVIKALDKCVIYNTSGDYRENASGLSCYYSYNGDLDELYKYMYVGCSDSFKYLFNYGFAGELPPAGMDFVYELGYEEEELPYIPDISTDGDEEYPLYFDDDGNVVLELDDDILNMLKGVYFELAYIDEEEDVLLMLGQDNDINMDWENGIFTDNFRGVWGAIDGNPVYMEVSYESDSYTAFAVPILLNGEEYNLRVIYDYEDEEFYIAGARRGLDDNGMADRNLIQLKPGDEITTLHYASTLSGDDELTMIPMDTFKVTKNTSFEEVDMGDGVFIMMFEMVDAKNNTAYSQMVQFTVEGDYMDVEILD